jgi:energy-converting hydrogenase Eha subunit A
MDQYTAILFSIISSIILGLPLIILETLFQIPSTVCKVFAYMIFSAGLILSFYISITLAALLGIDKANFWAFNYFTSFILDFFFINHISNYFKVSLYYISL